MPDFAFEYYDKLNRQNEAENQKGLADMYRRAGLDGAGNPVDTPPVTTTKPIPVKAAPAQQGGFMSGLVTGATQEGPAGMNSLLSNAFQILDSAATKVSEWTGLKKGGAFGMISKALDDAARAQQPSERDLQSQENFSAYIGRAVGALPFRAAEYVAGTAATGNPIAGWALVDAVRQADKGVWEAAKGGLVGAAMGRTMKAAELLPLWQRTATGAALFGGVAAAEGQGLPGVLSGAAVGGAMGAMGGARPPAKSKVTAAELKAAEERGVPEPAKPAEPTAPPEPIAPGEPAPPPSRETLREVVRAPTPPGQDILLPGGGVMQGPRLPLPEPSQIQERIRTTNERARELMTEAERPTPESQVDIFRQPQDIPLPGKAGVMISPRAALSDLREKIARDNELQQALTDLGLKPGDRNGEAKLIAHAEAAGIQPEQVGNGAKIVNAIPEAKAAVKEAAPKLFKVDPGMMAEIKGQVEQSTDPHALLSITVDAANPRDIRQSAANRLNALKAKDVGAAIRAGDEAFIKKVAQSGMLPTTFTSLAKGILKEKRPEPTEPPKPSPLLETLKGQAGFTATDLNFMLARAVGGALYGYSQGDTTEDRIKNALIFAGLGAIASPSMIKRIITSAKKVDPEIIREHSRRDEGLSPTVDHAVTMKPEDVRALADYLQKPEELPTTGRFEGLNFDHINQPEDVKFVVSKILSMFQKDIEKARGYPRGEAEPVSHEQTMYEARKLANDLGITERELLFWPEGKPMTRQEMQVARMYAAASDAELMSSLQQYKDNPTPETSNKFLDRVAKTALLNRTFVADASETARKLESLKIDVAGDEIFFVKHIGDVLSGVQKTGWSVDRLANSLLDLKEQAKRNQFVNNASKPGKADALLELWYGASLLSNPKTLLVNMIGTPMALGWSIGKRFIAAGMTEAMGKRGDPNFVQFSEPMAQMWGIRQGYQDAWKAASDAFERGIRTVGGSSKFEIPREGRLRAEAFGLDPGSILGQGLDYLGHAARFFPRVMLATDQYWETIARSMEISARAAREASSMTTDPREMARLMRQFTIEDNVPPGWKEAADRFAVYNSFNSELGGLMSKMNQGIGGLKDSGPMGPAYYLLLKSVAPFITIPTNIAKWTIHEGPLAMLSNHFYQEVAKGGADAQLAFAGVALGSMLMATGAYLAKEMTLTGRGPADAEQRKMLEAEYGWRPDSLKIADKYVAIDRLDPIAMPLTWAADMVEVAGHVDDADYFQLGGAAVLALTRSLANKTYLQGVTNFFDAIFSNEPKKMYKFMAGEVTSFVPGFVRGIRQQTDPYTRQVNTMMDALYNQVPGYSKLLPPVTDAFGKPILSGYGAGDDFVKIFGIINPIAYRTKTDNAVVDEILKNRVQISTPSDTIFGTSDSPWDFKPPDARNGVKLQPWEYHAYKKLSGEFAMEKLGELIQSDRYQRASAGPDGGKAMMIRNVIAVSREYGRKELLKQLPAIDQAVRDKLEARREALRASGQ